MREWEAITLAEREGRLGRFSIPDQEPTRIHIAPDLHYPFQNDDAVAHILDIARGCDVIVQIGDGLEAYGVSSYVKDPRVKHSLNDEAKAYRNGFWKPIRQQNPKARLVQIYGNHEERIYNHVRQYAAAMHDLPALTLGRLINAERFNIEVHPRSGLLIAGHRVKHGDVARAIGSARAEMSKHRCSGISGHTHRCEHETFVDAEGIRTDWWSAGHACRPELLDYLKTPPNWQLSGGVTLTVYPDGRTFVQEHRL